MHQFFPETWESGYSLGYFRYTIVIINGRPVHATCFIASDSFATAACFSFAAAFRFSFAFPKKEQHTAVKAVYDGKDVLLSTYYQTLSFMMMLVASPLVALMIDQP